VLATAGGCPQGATSLWSRVIKELEFISRGQPEGGYPLRNSGALIIRSNSAVRATGVEHSRKFLS